MMSGAPFAFGGDDLVDGFAHRINRCSTNPREAAGMKQHRAFSESPMPLFDCDEADAVAPLPAGKLPSYIGEHRKRLRERFLDGGAAALPDYEMLELILFRAIPRQDVKPLAHQLLDTFGDFNRVISAPVARLSQVKGVGDAVITELKIVEAAAQRLARSRILQRHVISSWDAVLDYCHTTMAHRDTEQFRVLYLDRKNVLVADEAQAQGTVDHVPVYPREVVKRALELNASALILVHNHPSGDPTPSEADILMTRQIKTAAEALGLTLHDHLVIGRSHELSFRSEGLL
jgi:DNA repair protein RadC